ncbi:phosphoribosylformylglycinamidine cyclo-ligase [Schleiferilactobacillus shenzhenensis]|uniref:Phosphoribosylformylglycinamidine cyclo-ligase n=1 Tax=Schleiferilactobacillus shenzhenensis LY-73 TaxID=1231336 RepID=U4TTT8_9LACO|nr:phosphoribosylformylglycinamidine cyclo-ligase [Schleiferilactobacillus shenzhenensis]ERL64842.1 PurM [Schleiferilactobacillus shenzhenensis LY-73]
MPIDYTQAGVDIAAGEETVHRLLPLAESTYDQNVRAGVGGFAAAYALPQDPDRLLVSATDGVGTKLLVALAQHKLDTIGIDLVAMIANDLLTTGAAPLFFLDYLAVDTLRPDDAAQILAGIVAGCRQAKLALIGGETAEMPGIYPANHFDLAGFGVGQVTAADRLPAHITAGDVLVGLPSSGLHSNGFSLVRRLLPVTDPALLVPTRIYEPIVRPLLDRHVLHGLAHITGGGLADNVPRMLPQDLAARIDPAAWQWPAVFTRLQAAGDLSLATMRQTFNLGIGMVLAVAPDQLAALPAEAIRLGRVVPRTQDALEWGPLA